MLWETGAGFTGLAMTGMLYMDGFFKAAEAVFTVCKAAELVFSI